MNVLLPPARRRDGPGVLRRLVECDGQEWDDLCEKDLDPLG